MSIGYADMIGTMDEMLARAVTWQAGNSLAQTLFTALYAHRPLEIVSPELQVTRLWSTIAECGAIVRNPMPGATLSLQGALSSRAATRPESH